MMNYIWVGLVVIAVIAGAFTGTMEGVLNNIFDFDATSGFFCFFGRFPGIFVEYRCRNLSRFDRYHGILLRTDEGHAGSWYLRQAREGDCAGYDQVIPGGSEGSPGDVRDGTLDCCQHAGYR